MVYNVGSRGIADMPVTWRHAFFAIRLRREGMLTLLPSTYLFPGPFFAFFLWRRIGCLYYAADVGRLFCSDRGGVPFSRVAGMATCCWCRTVAVTGAWCTVYRAAALSR